MRWARAMASVTAIEIVLTAGLAWAQNPPPARLAEAVSALEKLGAKVHRDAEGQVLAVWAVGLPEADPVCALLPQLPRLELLEIAKTKLTQAGLGHVAQCRHLRWLYLHHVALGSDALASMKGLSDLEVLNLTATGVGDGQLASLTGLPSLRVINLSQNAITDEGLKTLGRIGSLEVLALQKTKVTGDGLKYLKDMARLNVLNVNQCDVQDEHLRHVAPLENLRIIHLKGCPLSDKVVKQYKRKYPLLAFFRS